MQQPVGIFPNLLVRLSGTPARLEEMVKKLPPEILATRVENPSAHSTDSLGKARDKSGSSTHSTSSPRLPSTSFGTSRSGSTTGSPTGADSKPVWSVLEQIGHLIVIEELHDGRIDDFKDWLPALRAAD